MRLGSTVKMSELPVLVVVQMESSLHPKTFDPSLYMKVNVDVPPENSPHAEVEVLSKDVILDDNTGLYVRVYLPRLLSLEEDTAPIKVPLVVYIHGGAFFTFSPATAIYHNYLNSLAKEANAVCVSVNYRMAPQHRLPAAYDDCFTVLEWLDTGFDPWIESHADLNSCFVAGDSAGGNIAHHLGTRQKIWERLRLVGAILVHPFYGGIEMIGGEGIAENQELQKHVDELWKWALPEGANKDHPFCNPLSPTSPNLISALVYSRILVFVAEMEPSKDRHICYYEALKKAGKDAELIETEGEIHNFHLLNPQSENAPLMLNQLCHFIHSYSSLLSTGMKCKD